MLKKILINLEDNAEFLNDMEIFMNVLKDLDKFLQSKDLE